MTEQIIKNLKPLSDEQIESENLSLSDLWMLQMPDKRIYGPFSTIMLKNAFHIDENLQNEAIVYNLFHEKWSKPFDNASFQRRKLNIVDNSKQQYFQFYILSKGQKVGPLSIENIKDLLHKKELLYHEQISHDGVTWNKVYTYEVFDRRLNRLQEQGLPFSPNDNTLNNIAESTSEVLKKLKEKNEQIDALAGLAFIGHGNDKGQTIDDNKKDSESKSVTEDEFTHLPSGIENLIFQIKAFVIEHKKVSSAIVAAMLLIVVGNISLQSPRRDIASEFKESQKSKAPTKLLKTDTKPMVPAKRLSAKKVQPIERKKINRPKKIARPTPSNKSRTKPNELKEYRDQYYDNYENENYDLVDVEDPRVKEELSREMAGNFEDEQNQNNNDFDLNREKEFIDQVENGDLTPEMEEELEQKIEHYEEVSDFN